MSQPPPGTLYRFGPFRYDSAQRLLYRDDVLVPLVPKAADTLQALLERRGQVGGKAELMKTVWPDCVVEDVGLARKAGRALALIAGLVSFSLGSAVLVGAGFTWTERSGMLSVTLSVGGLAELGAGILALIATSRKPEAYYAS